MDKMPKCYQPYCPANTDCVNNDLSAMCKKCEYRTEKK